MTSVFDCLASIAHNLHTAGHGVIDAIPYATKVGTLAHPNFCITICPKEIRFDVALQ